MKRVILCIEDDIYKTACMKNCAEAGFHLEVRISETSSEVDLLEKIITADADEILYIPSGGVDAFMTHLKTCKATRLNTEVRIILCQQFEASVSKVVKDTVSEFAGMSKTARTKIRRAHARARQVDPATESSATCLDQDPGRTPRMESPRLRGGSARVHPRLTPASEKVAMSVSRARAS
jgi:hypothetical protein